MQNAVEKRRVQGRFFSGNIESFHGIQLGENDLYFCGGKNCEYYEAVL